MAMRRLQQDLAVEEEKRTRWRCVVVPHRS